MNAREIHRKDFVEVADAYAYKTKALLGTLALEVAGVGLAYAASKGTSVLPPETVKSAGYGLGIMAVWDGLRFIGASIKFEIAERALAKYDKNQKKEAELPSPSPRLEQTSEQ